MTWVESKIARRDVWADGLISLTVELTVAQVLEACGRATLKVILETSELETYDHIRCASFVAMRVLRAGDFIVDRGVIHAWRNDGAVPAVYASVTIPAHPVGQGRTI